MFILGAVLNGVVTCLFYAKNLTFCSALIGFTRIPTVLEGIGAFSFLRETEKAPALLLSLDRETFPVYLLHMVFVRLVLRYLGFNPYAYGPAGSILCFLLLTAGITLVSFLISRFFSWLSGAWKTAS